MTMVNETAPVPGAAELTPAAFCRTLLATLDAAEGRTRRRKRDQTPDRIGLGIKRDLLEAGVAADPAPDEFEGWLVEQVFLEYRMARHQPEMAAWLARGAPSDDAALGQPGNVEPSWAPRRDRRAGPGDGAERHGAHVGDGESSACTCDLPNG